jgi:cytochrome c
MFTRAFHRVFIKITTILTLMIVSAGGVYAAGVDSALIIRPKGTTAFAVEKADSAALLARGEQLWNDKSLSKKGKTACSSCHKTSTKMFKTTFLESYPHNVKMANKKAKLDSITAEGMVQFCMVVPMKNEPLPWDSEDLAALTAYSEGVIQQQYIEAKAAK